MRWLCDENVPRILVEELRRRGHDAAWIRETAPGVSDVEVLALAVNDHRICLTFDKDFGELAGSLVPRRNSPPFWKAAPTGRGISR